MPPGRGSTFTAGELEGQPCHQKKWGRPIVGLLAAYARKLLAPNWMAPSNRPSAIESPNNLAQQGPWLATVLIGNP